MTHLIFAIVFLFRELSYVFSFCFVYFWLSLFVFSFKILVLPYWYLCHFVFSLLYFKCLFRLRVVLFFITKYLVVSFLSTYVLICSSEKKCSASQIPSVDTFLLPSQFVLYMTHPSNTPVLQSSSAVLLFLIFTFLSLMFLPFAIAIPFCFLPYVLTPSLLLFLFFKVI